MTASTHSYAIAGKGHWGSRIFGMLESEGRRVTALPGARREPKENWDHYEERWATAFRASATQIAWLCVPPGEHVAKLIQAAISAGLHVLVEKPWLINHEETTRLQQAAQRQSLQTAVHFEYCLLDAVQIWRQQFSQRDDLQFGGVFQVAAGNPLGIPPLQNLGSHLIAMRIYAAPLSRISTVQCGYEQPDQRKIWLNSGNARIAEADFFGSKEPIVQRFITKFEAAIAGRDAPFPFDFSLALQVKEQLERLHTDSKTPNSATATGTA
jgi:ribosome modulation factor